jgi:N-acetylmuramoyl-L-alanine amidase
MVLGRFRHVPGLAAAIAAVFVSGSAGAPRAGGVAEAFGFSVTADAGGVRVLVPMSGVPPFRVFTLDDPMRVVVDFRDLDWTTAAAPAVPPSGLARALRFGLFRPGWSRLVIDLAAPARVAAASIEGGAFRLHLVPEDRAHFRASAGAPDSALWALEDETDGLPVPLPRPERAPGEPLVVVIDPGHGGIDPGAVRDGLTEKAIALDVARTLAARLAASGRFIAILTREDDRFLSLRERVRFAQDRRADVFLSLHVNTEETGTASGVSVFSLSDAASDAAAARLADLENQADVLAGLDLEGEGSAITRVLVEMAQRDTNQRSRQLAAAVLQRLDASASLIRTNPHRGAGFLVLRAPDVPSLLLELGFLSSDADRARMTDPAWSESLAADLVTALDGWSEADHAQRRLARR